MRMAKKWQKTTIYAIWQRLVMIIGMRFWIFDLFHEIIGLLHLKSTTRRIIFLSFGDRGDVFVGLGGKRSGESLPKVWSRQEWLSWISRTGLPGVSRSTTYKKSMKMIWIVIRKSVEFMQLMVFAIVAGVLRIRSKGNQRCQYLSWRNFCARVNRTPYVFPRIFHSKMCCVTKSHGQCFWLRPWTCKI